MKNKIGILILILIGLILFGRFFYVSYNSYQKAKKIREEYNQRVEELKREQEENTKRKEDTIKELLKPSNRGK